MLDELNPEKELDKKYEQSKVLLKDKDKVEKFPLRLEAKLKKIPFAGDKLADVPIMISLVRNFIRKEYTEIPLGTIIAIVAALLYFLSPFDFMPDSIPFLGYIDDAAVISVCWKLVDSDIEEYQQWRKEQN